VAVVVVVELVAVAAEAVIVHRLLVNHLVVAHQQNQFLLHSEVRTTQSRSVQAVLKVQAKKAASVVHQALILFSVQLLRSVVVVVAETTWLV
jgi:hypothetical protein